MPLSTPLSAGLSTLLSRPLSGDESGGAPFDPSLVGNPLLLLDSEAGVYGEFAQPALDFNPAVGGIESTYGPDFVCTRAGNATVMDENGDIVDVAPNTMRIDHTLGYPALLSEEAATQLVDYTDFSSGWIRNGASTTDTTYRSQPASTVRCTTNGIFRTPCDTLDGTTYRGSFWARRISGTGTVYMQHVFSATGNTTTIPLTTDWQFFEYSFLGRSGGGEVEFGIRPVVVGDEVEIAMPQVAAHTANVNHATSFIPNTTGAALTRNGDVCSISGTDFSDMFGSTNEGTIYYEVHPRNVALLSLYGWNLSDGGFNERIYSKCAINEHQVIFNAGAVLSNLDVGTTVQDQLNRMCSSWKTGQANASINGSDDSIDADTPATIPALNQLHLGVAYTSAGNCNGWISRFIYWPTHYDNL